MFRTRPNSASRGCRVSNVAESPARGAIKMSNPREVVRVLLLVLLLVLVLVLEI